MDKEREDETFEAYAAQLERDMAELHAALEDLTIAELEELQEKIDAIIQAKYAE